jgi:arginyl-tRNA synthetase
MNLYAEFQDLIASILRWIAANGRLPADLDLQRFSVEPPRDSAHGDLAINMLYVKEARPFRGSARACRGNCIRICR